MPLASESHAKKASDAASAAGNKVASKLTTNDDRSEQYDHQASADAASAQGKPGEQAAHSAASKAYEAKDKALETAKKYGQQAMEVGQQYAGQAKELGQKYGQQALVAGQQAAEYVRETAENLMHKDTSDQVQDQAQGAKRSMKKGAQALENTAKSATADSESESKAYGEKAKAKYAGAKGNYGEEAAHNAASAGYQARGSVCTQLQKTATSVLATSVTVFKFALQSVQNMVNSGKEGAVTAKRSAEAQVDRDAVTKQVKETAGEVVQAAKDVTQSVKEMANEALDKVQKSRSQEAKDKAESGASRVGDAFSAAGNTIKSAFTTGDRSEQYEHQAKADAASAGDKQGKKAAHTVASKGYQGKAKAKELANDAADSMDKMLKDAEASLDKNTSKARTEVQRPADENASQNILASH